MLDLSHRLRRSILPFFLLAAAGSAAVPAAGAEAVLGSPEAVNAWGRKVDVDAQVRAQLAAKIAAKMGSPDWVPVAMEILDLHGEILPRSYAFAHLDLRCGERYRRTDPGKTFEQFLAYLETPEGKAWEQACVVDQLNDPQVDPRLVDGMLATLEVGMMLPQMLQALQQKRAQEGLQGAPAELSPALLEKMPALSRDAFALSNCLLRKAMEGLPVGTALTDPLVLVDPMKAAVQSGACKAFKPGVPAAAAEPAAEPTAEPAAEPATQAAAEPASPAGPTMIDAWGNTVDLAREAQADMAELQAAGMGSPGWGALALRLLEMEGRILPRMAWATALDIQCGKNYRREHPESSREQYGAYLETVAGEKWETDCLAAQLNDPQVDPKLVEGAIASMEAAILLPSMLEAVRVTRSRQGLEDAAELTPGMEERFPATIQATFRRFDCLIREALKSVPIGKVVADPSSFEQPLQAATESGLCDAA